MTNSTCDGQRPPPPSAAHQLGGQPRRPVRLQRPCEDKHLANDASIARRHYDAQHLAAPHLAALQARIGPLHVVNGHMPLAAGEVAELRRPATLRHVLGVLVDLGATLGFIAFVAFLLSRAGA